MSLLHELKQTRAAREHATEARERWLHCTWPVKRGVAAHPLTWVSLVAAGGFVGGWLAKRPPEGLIGLWDDPALRWALRMLAPGSGG
jgi:hypothetical protein